MWWVRGVLVNSSIRTNRVRSMFFYHRLLHLQSACIGMEGIDLTSLYNCILFRMKIAFERDRTCTRLEAA